MEKTKNSIIMISFFTNSGKMDHTCFTHNGHGYAAGGWNNDFIGSYPNMTEKYNHGEKEWVELPFSHDKMKMNMLRSSGYAVVNNKPTLIGGVSCNINTGGRTTCTKNTDVYYFSNSLEWRIADWSISTPRSSHLVLKVPVTTKFVCEKKLHT